jgi:hypothetical protein
MADIFSNQRGRVVAVDSPGVPMSLFVEGWGGFFGFKSIITGMKIYSRVGVQFAHTLRDFIYIYVFGDRIGDMNISGISFFVGCGGGACHGLEYVNSWYLANRASQRASPVTVVLGCGTPYLCFLVDMTLDMNDPENLIGQFNLGLKVVPEKSNLG